MKALTCLEANEASPADVFIFWHSLLAATKDVVMKKNNQFPEDVQEEIFGIMSMRHEQLFGEDGDLSSGANVYLAAAYLHPRESTLILKESYSNIYRLHTFRYFS